MRLEDSQYRSVYTMPSCTCAHSAGGHARWIYVRLLDNLLEYCSLFSYSLPAVLRYIAYSGV